MISVSQASLPLIQQFALRADDTHNLAAWLSVFVDGQAPDSVVIPPNEEPLIHLLAVLRDNIDREQAIRLGEAASELLMAWLSAHAEDMDPGPASLARLRAILEILERVPAAPKAASRLLSAAGVTLPVIDGVDSDPHRQILRALGLSAPGDTERERVLDLLRDEIDDPRYAVAAFGALQRLSLGQAIAQVPRLVGSLDRGGLRPHQALWSLFRSLEESPALAAELRRIADSENGMTNRIREIVAGALGGKKAFPLSWGAFEKSKPVKPQPASAFRAEFLGDDVPSQRREPRSRNLSLWQSGRDKAA